MFDPKCHALAAAFLADHPTLVTPARIDILAQVIQDAIEAQIEDFSTTSLWDCAGCDNYVLNPAEAPHCPSCARLVREGKPL